MSLPNGNFNLKRHLAWTSCQEVAEIMMPNVKQHGITVFNFYKMYFDKTAIRLSTHREWTEHYFKNNYLNTTTVPQSYLGKPLNYFLWLINDSPRMLNDAATNFNISNGITIAIRSDDAIEFYGFGTEVRNLSIANFYVNNLELLHSYCLNFKERASSILAQYEKNKLILLDGSSNDVSSSPIKKHHMSRRESECANLILQGKTCKEIGKTLNLSVRTIEYYLENLKTKLTCRNKTELIIQLNNMTNFQQ